MRLIASIAALIVSATITNAEIHASGPSLLHGVLTSAPVASLFSKIGIDISKTLENPDYWDERIPLITDDNYNDIVVNELLTEEEEEARTWAIIITVTGGESPRDSISKLMDQMFDDAHNESLVAGDLPSVRWGRIDYFNVTYLTTKWNIWSAPFLVILRKRGQELRFYKGHNLRLKEEELRTFLRAEDWKLTPTWSSPYAPGGSREPVLHYFAVAMARFYNLAVRIPRWLFFIISGAIGSLLLNLMHGSTAQRPAQRHEAEVVPDSSSDNASAPDAGTSSSVSPTRKGDDATKKRKRKLAK
jgi:hypothetical protein